MNQENEYKKKLKNELNGEFELIGEYTNSRTSTKHRHSCGYEWNIRPSTLIQKQSCPKCSGRAKKTTADFKADVKKLVGDEYTVLGEYKNNKTKIKMKHNKCEHEYEVRPDQFLSSGNRCPKCGRNIKSNETFVKEIKELVGDEYVFLEEYVKNDVKLKIKHNICGHEYMVDPSHFLMGSRCPKCAVDSRTKSHIDFVEEVKQLTELEYEVLGVYKNSKTDILMKHNTCSHTWNASPTSFIYQNNRCPKCFGTTKKTTKSFKKEVKQLVGDEYEVLGKYNDNATKINMKHNTCGHEYEVRPFDFIKINGNRCPKCNGVLKKTTDTFKEEILNIVGKEYEVLGEYISNKTPLLMKHNTCKHEWMANPKNFIYLGTRCPKCANSGVSKLEIEVGNYIKEIYTGKIELNNTKLLGGQEVDIYLPTLKIAIEFDGLYWHSQSNGKYKKYHLDKTEKLKALGIRLIHIFEDEWLNKKTIVKSKLAHILKVSKSKSIYARKCKIKIVSAVDKNTFLEKNHIQGKDQSKIKLGLYYEDKLVSVMTFGALRVSLGSSDVKDGYELIRYANDINYRVVGGFSKLLKYFRRNYEYSLIKTFADIRWSADNNVYNTVGFELKHQSTPNYWYFKSGDKNKIRTHRFAFRKQVLDKKFPETFDETLTEYENMLLVNYERIWDCGNYVYELTNKK